jgi:hypothetical protein
LPCGTVRTDIRGFAILAILAIAGCGAPPASGPPASPRISCPGIPTERCDEAVASVELSLPNTTPVAIDVTCVSGTCTPETGAMDIVVTLADGSQLRSSTISWSQAATPAPADRKPLPVPVPPPVVPVEPQCHGVPVSTCRTMAETAFGEVSDQAVVSILVRCSEPPCTDDHGVGETLVTYADGSSRTSSWEYAGG